MQLDDDTNERINCWARLVTTLLDTGLAEDKLPLVDWVSNSLQKGITSILYQIVHSV